MRETWKDRIALQAVALFPTELAVDDEPQFRMIVNIVARHGGKLGGLTFVGEAPGPKLELALDRTFAMTAAHGLDLDLHVDESTSPDARSLERIALAAVRHRFMGRIVVGHCCSLTLAEDDHRRRVIELLGEANVAVVSHPVYAQHVSAGSQPRQNSAAAREQRHCTSSMPPELPWRSRATTRATRSTPMAISTCWKYSARRYAHPAA